MPMCLGLAGLEMMQSMLAMCEFTSQSIIAVLDCTGHTVDGEKKDAEFIVPFFKSKVDEFDP